jgi:hypothetical protein
LRQVDFVFDGNEIRGLEQNPETKSRWAQMARSDAKVMQFLSEGRYVANVVDGKMNLYGSGPGRVNKAAIKALADGIATVEAFGGALLWLPSRHVRPARCHDTAPLVRDPCGHY